jgi:hypothetical protein
MKKTFFVGIVDQTPAVMILMITGGWGAWV